MRHFDMPDSSLSETQVTALRTALSDPRFLIKGHFELSSRKRHSPFYFAKDQVLANARLAAQVSFWIADAVIEEDVQTIVGLATSGIRLLHGVADAVARLHPNRHLASVFADKDDDGKFVFKRGSIKELRDHRRVVIVEDVLTSGTSVKQVADLVRAHGGYVTAVGAICRRGRITAETLGVPFLQALLELDLPTYSTPNNCPLCRADTPLSSEFGHG